MAHLKKLSATLALTVCVFLLSTRTLSAQSATTVTASDSPTLPVVGGTDPIPTVDSDDVVGGTDPIPTTDGGDSDDALDALLALFGLA